MITRILAAMFGLCMALFMIEAGLRIFYGSLPAPIQIALRFVKVTPFSDERLAPYPLWQSDRDYQTVVRPGARDLLQVGSISLRFKVSTYNWWGGRVGFRSPQPETGGFDAVAIGDSHTFCFVEIEDCWVNLLSTRINLNLVNMGQPITGSESHARLYYDYVAKPELKLRQPKLVLWQFYNNDYNDDFALAQLNGTNKTPAPDLQTIPTPEPGSVEAWFSENSAIFALVRELRLAQAGYSQPFVNHYQVTVEGKPLQFGNTYTETSSDMTQARNLEGEEYSHAAILRTRKIVEDNGGRFVMILMPSKEEVYLPLVEAKQGKDVAAAHLVARQRMVDFCKAQNLTCLDLLDGLAAVAKRDIALFHGDDTHLNPAGNKLVADLVAGFLRDQGIIQ